MLSIYLFFSLFSICKSLFFCFSFNNIQSQTLKGKIQNDAREPILANIAIKNSENKNLISEFFNIDNSEEFIITLKKNYSKIYFEISAMGYQKVTDSILNPQKGKTYLTNYTLKTKTTELEEVIINPKNSDLAPLESNIKKAINIDLNRSAPSLTPT